ncbi:MAG: adenylosuccinate lyase [Rhabdochlamydiaceae bacterium]|nr:adenylosuccinate lyase [Rhabdochlamydiaceae bacterium]
MSESPLASRYASPEMLALFSPHYKYTTWRKLWISLAKAQRDLGLPISVEQILEMEQKIEEFSWDRIASYEKKLCHDVMAHIHAFGDVAPLAKGIIHLGATSCYVTDNTDLIQMKEALTLLQAKLLGAISHFSSLAKQYADLPCLSYTHLQAAQPTTIGKRICLWIQDFLMDFETLVQTTHELRFLGLKGATGTQASFLALFDGNTSKVQELEEKIAKAMGFSRIIPISGQTYTRKQDVRIFQALSNIAISCHKFATDLRLLAHMKEMEESFHKDQVGSSAMPYKRNPTRSERLCGLSRYLLSLQDNPTYTAATQWLERSLDDSANRRVSIPEAFLCADAVLNLLYHLSSHLVIYPKMIEQRVLEELPFLATENIIMAASQKGKNRQELHEALRKKCQRLSDQWKLEGEKGDLFQEIAEDPLFALSKEELQRILNPSHFIGRAPEQVKEFLLKEIDPVLQKYAFLKTPTIRVEI